MFRLSEKLKESLSSQLPPDQLEGVEPLQGDDMILQNLQLQVDTVLQVIHHNMYIYVNEKSFMFEYNCSIKIASFPCSVFKQNNVFIEIELMI